MAQELGRLSGTNKNKSSTPLSSTQPLTTGPIQQRGAKVAKNTQSRVEKFVNWCAKIPFGNAVISTLLGEDVIALSKARSQAIQEIQLQAEHTRLSFKGKNHPAAVKAFDQFIEETLNPGILKLNDSENITKLGDAILQLKGKIAAFVRSQNPDTPESTPSKNLPGLKFKRKPKPLKSRPPPTKEELERLKQSFENTRPPFPS